MFEAKYERINIILRLISVITKSRISERPKLSALGWPRERRVNQSPWRKHILESPGGLLREVRLATNYWVFNITGREVETCLCTLLLSPELLLTVSHKNLQPLNQRSVKSVYVPVELTTMR